MQTAGSAAGIEDVVRIEPRFHGAHHASGCRADSPHGVDGSSARAPRDAASPRGRRSRGRSRGAARSTIAVARISVELAVQHAEAAQPERSSRPHGRAGRRASTSRSAAATSVGSTSRLLSTVPRCRPTRRARRLVHTRLFIAVDSTASPRRAAARCAHRCAACASAARRRGLEADRAAVAAARRVSIAKAQRRDGDRQRRARAHRARIRRDASATTVREAGGSGDSLNVALRDDRERAERPAEQPRTGRSRRRSSPPAAGLATRRRRAPFDADDQVARRAVAVAARAAVVGGDDAADRWHARPAGGSSGSHCRSRASAR